MYAIRSYYVLRFVGRWRRPEPPDASMLELPPGLAPSPVNPPLERMREIAADRSPAAAFMINLLAYRERAEYPEGTRGPAPSGRAAYRRYGVVAARSVALRITSYNVCYTKLLRS